MKSKQEKIELISSSVRGILEILGMDLTDDSLQGTPLRVAKMFVNEIFMGLDPQCKPKASTFENKYRYGEILVEKNITLYSICDCHLQPIVGKAHVGYISKGTVLGLSKMNRMVDYFARKPQTLEHIAFEVVKELQENLKTDDVICVIDAKYLCQKNNEEKSRKGTVLTFECGGVFKEETKKNDFISYVAMNTRYH